MRTATEIAYECQQFIEQKLYHSVVKKVAFTICQKRVARQSENLESLCIGSRAVFPSENAV